MARAVELVGHLDVLGANHARSAPDGTLAQVTADVLDGHWAVDARSVVLLVQALAAQHDGRPGGRAVLLTSGQGLGPMPGEVAYAAAEGALAAITPTLADELAPGILLNTVNPGPVDTGYATGAEHAAVAARFPAARGVSRTTSPGSSRGWSATRGAGWWGRCCTPRAGSGGAEPLSIPGTATLRSRDARAGRARRPRTTHRCISSGARGHRPGDRADRRPRHLGSRA